MKKEMLVVGMTCNHCRMSVIGALEALPGVRDVQVDLESKRVTFDHDGQVTEAALRQAIEEVGFEVG